MHIDHVIQCRLWIQLNRRCIHSVLHADTLCTTIIGSRINSLISNFPKKAGLLLESRWLCSPGILMNLMKALNKETMRMSVMLKSFYSSFMLFYFLHYSILLMMKTYFKGLTNCCSSGKQKSTLHSVPESPCFVHLIRKRKRLKLIFWLKSKLMGHSGAQKS